MYSLYCLCKFRNQFTELQPVQEFANLHAAIWAARNVAINKRVAVQVRDQFGQICFQADFPFRG